MTKRVEATTRAVLIWLAYFTAGHLLPLTWIAYQSLVKRPRRTLVGTARPVTIRF